jgi:hypothetical protein
MLALIGVTKNIVPETAGIPLQRDHRGLLFAFQEPQVSRSAGRDLRNACPLMGVYNRDAPGYHNGNPGRLSQ